MSISLYYSFVHECDLTESAMMKEIAIAWSREFDDKPNEPLFWYPPEAVQNGYLHSGSTTLPGNMKRAWVAIVVGCSLLSSLRREHGGLQWSVAVDDHECPWREDDQQFDPN